MNTNLFIPTTIEELYFKAFYNALLEYNDTLKGNNEKMKKEACKKVVFQGINYIMNIEEPKEYTLTEAEKIHQWNEIIINFMSLLTPKEFETIFPIDKRYDGIKYGIKDYYTTKEYLKTLNPNEPIRNKIDEFLWEYQNELIFEFVIKYLESISRLRRLQGQPTLAEKFCKDNNIPIYTLQQDSKGKEFIIDDKGRSHKVKKKYPFKVIKGRE